MYSQIFPQPLICFRPNSKTPISTLQRLQTLRANPSDDVVGGVVGDKVDELLRREENKPLLDGLEAASRRVELARQALADIKRQEDEASRSKDLILQLQTQESQIAESQKELLQARSLVDEAERSLLNNVSSENDLAESNYEVNEDAERFESIKAAVVSSSVGVLAALPISFYQATTNVQLVQNLVVVFISCSLFGVTFRYTVRRDLDNIQLKTGTSAAFGVVKGLAAVEAAHPFGSNGVSLLAQVFDGAVYVSQSVLIFLFSAIALDFCFKMGLLSPFPIRK